MPFVRKRHVEESGFGFNSRPKCYQLWTDGCNFSNQKVTSRGPRIAATA